MDTVPKREETYEPPRLTRVGLLRDLLLTSNNGGNNKSGPGPDGNQGLGGGP